MKKSFAILLVAIIFAGCSNLKDLADTQKPKLSVENVQVTDFSFSEIEVTYDVNIDNPNPVALQMLSYDYNLDINGSSFVKGDQQEGLDIEASGSSMVRIPVTINFQDLYRSVKGLVDKDESSYQFMSHLAFDLPIIGRTEIPVSKKGNVPMIKLPKLKVKNLAVQNVSLSGADVNLKLQLDNPNGFGMNVDAMQYNLEVNGSNWASGNALNGTSIQENGTTELNIPISLNIGQMGMSAYRILSGSESLDYSFDSNLKFNALHSLLGSSDFDFSKSGKIPISR